MQDEPIRYSRSQCARLFGISMDTLRYYERIGLLHVARDKRSRQCVYTEHEIMRLLDFRKIKSLGFSNDELLGTFNRTDGLSHLKVFDESLEKLQAQVDELHARMRHVRGMKGIFQTISGRLDAVRIGELPERRYLLFDRENEPLVALAMEGLPYLNYGYWVDRRAIVGEMPFEIKLAIDVVPLAAHHPAIYETLENSGRILSNGNGMKVYRYRIYEKIGDMQPGDFAPLKAYAEQHRFALRGDVFGGILGPEVFPTTQHEGFVLTQTIEIE